MIEYVIGDFVIWIDNDVFVFLNWFICYYEVFEKYFEVIFFGGSIEFEFVGLIFGWLEDMWDLCKVVFVICILGDEEIEFNEFWFFYGVNFVIWSNV